jgi:hypothetical protein
MNNEAYEKLICILLAQIDAMQEDTETRAMINRNQMALIRQLEAEIAELKGKQPKPPKRPVGRPKGSKNKQKVAA